MIVARRPAGKRAEAAQQPKLLLAEARDIGKTLRSRQNRQQRQQQDFIQRISHLAGLPMVRQVLEMIQKSSRLKTRRKRRVQTLHHRPPQIESAEIDRFSTSPLCHALLHPIALQPRSSSLDKPPPGAYKPQFSTLRRRSGPR